MGLLNAFKQYVRDAMPGGALNPEVTKQGLLDSAALGTAPVPILGDAVGLLSDLSRFKDNPEERTPTNIGLSALGVLPFVPALGTIKRVGQLDTANLKLRGGKYLDLDDSETFARVEKMLRDSGQTIHPQTVRHEVARRNAMIDGLPANHTPMDRARALGFDTEAFHETWARDIEAFDNAKLGSNTATNTDSRWAQRLAKKGHWFADRDISDSMSSLVTYPVMLPKPTRSYASLDEAAKGRSLPSVSKVMDEEFGTTSFIVKDPSRIRSRFAAFDPARIHENDLLGRINLPMLGLLGVGAGTAAYLNRDKER